MRVTVCCQKHKGIVVLEKLKEIGVTLMPSQLRDPDILMCNCRPDQKDIIDKFEHIMITAWAKDEDEYVVCPKCNHKF